MTDDETRLSARRAARDPAPPVADEPDDATELAQRRRGDSTRLSRRRIAESATQPQTQPATETSGGPADVSDTVAPRRRPRARGEDPTLRPPADLAAPSAEGGAHLPGRFGGEPQHYYPRIRHTQSAAGAGVWPEPPRVDEGGHAPQVLDAAGRERRREAGARSRKRRVAVLVGASLAAVAAATAVAVTLL
ncbi:hypothetical protein [Demequina iriomotensis]|uniref:hypothetical protein n=1 Tax=Demequina iriomotensis TaxID=1536641 RepID=UPI00078334AA|nr:hypothetical protein [Demequina iriomotensis]